MTEKQKCQKCNQQATTEFKLKISETEVQILILCDTCRKAEITCQECKQEIKDLKINQITKSDGSVVRTCETCYQKIQEVKQSVQKSRELRKELEKYLKDYDDYHVAGKKVFGKIKENLTKEQLLAFKKLLEDNMTGEPSPTNGGKWLGGKRGTPEIEEALKSEGTDGIRQPYCYWLEVKKKVEELEKQEYLNNQRERETIFSLQPAKFPTLLMLNQQKAKPLTGMFR